MRAPASACRTRSLQSAIYVAKRLSKHFVEVLRHGRGMLLTNGNALAGRLTKSAFDYARAKGVEHKMGGITPLRRTGTVEELAAVVAFLASDDSGFIDGQLIGADGGLSSTHPFGKVAL